MTDQEINVAIAEACPELGFWMNHEGHWHFKDGSHCKRGSIYHDLNAMHAAEPLADKDRYPIELDKIVRPANMDKSHYWYPLIHATARQRAEAFLRTVGKWKDEKEEK